jgi:hypothetical protein
MAKKYELEYRSDEYLKHEKHFNQLKDKCRRDKQYLNEVMRSLQDYHRGTGSQAGVLRQYNQDVRTVRENEDMLRRF